MRERMPDLLLFAPVPRHNGTRTSRAAAESIEPHAASCRERVFEYIAGRYFGTTAEQASRATGIRLDTVKARIHDLGRLGWVVALRETGKTSTGSSALQFIRAEDAHGRDLEPWPLPRIDWKAKHDAMERRAIDAERRVEELEQRLARTNQPQESAA